MDSKDNDTAASDQHTHTVTEHMAPQARRFAAVERLYGTQTWQRFARAHVAVIGIGGVGSWVAEALARSGVGHLTLVDLDHVALSNTNRQIHALDGNFGLAKVLAMAHRIERINPLCQVTAIEDFIDAANLDALLGTGYTYLVDAIDSARTKSALIAWCVARGQPMVTVGSAGGQFDPLRLRIGDLAQTIQDPLLARVRSQLRRQYGFTRRPRAKFKVPAVYSDEPLMYPPPPATRQQSSDPAARMPPAAGLAMHMGLQCAGFGSSVCVTAAFGLAAAAHVLRAIAVDPAARAGSL